MEPRDLGLAIVASPFTFRKQLALALIRDPYPQSYGVSSQTTPNPSVPPTEVVP